ncbi:MAG: DUF7701 domain-containing protein [Gammaproteobacteria bacterium]
MHGADGVNYLDRLATLIHDEVPAASLPQEDTRVLFRMYAILLLALGEAVTTEDVHNAWVAWMSGRDPYHSSLVPYKELTSDVASEDGPYVEAIRRLARRSGPDAAV